jgi:hypothetical protein
MQIADAKLLKEKLGEILVDGPLYRKFAYTGRDCHFTRRGAMPGTDRYGELPSELRMICGNAKCKAPEWWKVSSDEVFFGSDFIKQRRYTCKNCGQSTQHYEFIWQENKDVNLFIKVGQWPPSSIDPSPELEKALGPEDSELYKKGLVNFQFGYGIGAVAYFRRVLENKINALLDLIAEAARNESIANEHIASIEDVKNSHRVEDKIVVASKILPAHLKPGGHNPLDKLYAPLSAGLHGESDDECLETFAEARFVFEYLFKNLTESNEEARKYVQRLSAPGSQEKPAQAGQAEQGEKLKK